MSLNANTNRPQKKVFKTLSILAMALFGLISCSKIPDGVIAVENFKKEKYLGKWYEIARFDFRFERGLNNTTAEYTLNNDGTIKVVNRGYNVQKSEWEQVVGKAKFVGDRHTAMLKVSFFGPFYAGYNVIAIDNEYQYALVAGGSLEYLWILSRTTNIPTDIKESYLNVAREYGFKTENLLWIEHDKN